MARLELGRHRRAHRLGQHRLVHAGALVLEQHDRGRRAAGLRGERLEHLQRLLALALRPGLRGGEAGQRDQLLVQRLLQPRRQRLHELGGVGEPVDEPVEELQRLALRVELLAVHVLLLRVQRQLQLLVESAHAHRATRQLSRLLRVRVIRVRAGLGLGLGLGAGLR